MRFGIDESGLFSIPEQGEAVIAIGQKSVLVGDGIFSKINVILKDKNCDPETKIFVRSQLGSSFAIMEEKYPVNFPEAIIDVNRVIKQIQEEPGFSYNIEDNLQRSQDALNFQSGEAIIVVKPGFASLKDRMTKPWCGCEYYIFDRESRETPLFQTFIGDLTIMHFLASEGKLKDPQAREFLDRKMTEYRAAKNLIQKSQPNSLARPLARFWRRWFGE